jgi:hypothetical protein
MGAAIASTGGMAAAAFAFMAPYYIVTMAAAHSVAGAMKSLPAEKVQEIESALNDTLVRLDVQRALADRLAQIMSSETSLQLRAVDAKGPASVGETPTYADLRSAGVDTVVEVGVTRIGFVRCETGIYPTYDDVNCPPEAKTKPMVSLNVLARSRLVRVSDGEVLADRRFGYSSPHRDFDRWIAADGRLLVEGFEDAYADLAGQVTDELFLVTSIPLPNFSIWLLPSDPRWGVCFLAPVYPGVEHSSMLAAVAGGFGKDDDACRESLMHFSPVDSSQPNLRWEAFPRGIDREELDPAVLAKIRGVTYDLKIWEVERCERGHLVYARSGLAAPEHRLDEALAAGQRYFWSFRAQFTIDGNPMSTQWAMFNPSGCNLQQHHPIPSNRDYRFMTPP